MKAIFATTDNYLLGIDNKLPWENNEEYKEVKKADMKHFKEVTMGKRIVMGYNTWLSIGEKPLKGRKMHYVITSKPEKNNDNQNVIFITLKNFIKKYGTDNDDIVCIGGAKTYEALLDYFTEIYYTTMLLDKFDEKNFENNKKHYLPKEIKNILSKPNSFNVINHRVVKWNRVKQEIYKDSKGNNGCIFYQLHRVGLSESIQKLTKTSQ